MDSANQHPTNGSLLSSSSSAADKENIASTLTQTEEIQVTNELFWEFAYKNEVPRLTEKINQLCQENTQLHQERLVLEFQNIQLKEVNGKQNGGFEDDVAPKRTDGLEARNQKSLEMISTLGKQQKGDHKEKHAREIANPKSNNDDLQPLVIKKLQYAKNRNVWLGYLTVDEDEKPKTISLVNSHLVIDGINSQKKLILDAVFSQYENDPFCFEHLGDCNGRFDVSYLLKKVLSCTTTDLFLYCQNLCWKEFEKLISSKMVKKLYLSNNVIKDENNHSVSIEKILENAPNIERFAYFEGVEKETFENLFDLPSFAKLREFKIYNIYYDDFDAQSFLTFMKKHPNAHFFLLFCLIGCDKYVKGYYESMKEWLEYRAPVGRLEIDSF